MQRFATLLWGGLAGAALVLTALSGLAQEARRDLPAGRSLSFAFGERLESNHSDRDGSDTLSVTTLGLTAGSKTRSQSLRFALSGSLRAGEGGLDLYNRRLGLRYSLSGASAELDTRATLREDDITYLRAGDLLRAAAQDPSARLTAPDDIDQITGEGTRRQATLAATLRFGQDAPLGGSIGLSQDRLSYSAVSNSDLRDQLRRTAGLTLRADLNRSLALTTTLRHSHTTRDGSADRETNSLGLGLWRKNKADTYGLRLSATHTQEGTRSETSAVWARDLSEVQSLRLSFGLARSVSGRTLWTSTSSYTQDRQDSRLRLRLSRGAKDRSDGRESVVTAFVADYDHRLSPRDGLFARLSLSDTEILADSSRVQTALASVGYSHRLTQDWALRLGLSQNLRDDSTSGQDRSQRLSLSINRRFDSAF